MALETVVFPNELLFSNCTTTSTKDIYSTMSSSWAHDCLFWDSSSSPPTAPPDSNWDIPSSSPPPPPPQAAATASATAAVGRRKRRRAKSSKNKEEVENQRMTHIAVERNRRRQMNDYLSVLRSLMPPSYVQRGDQASIIGGAINFVKELEQLLQSLEAQKRIKNNNPTSSAATTSTTSDDSDACGLSGFFTFPQYTTYSGGGGAAAAEKTTSTSTSAAVAVADIEVTMVESHANVKVLSRRRPKQLLKMFVGLQNLRLTTLHLNVTTVDPMVLYSFSVKVEDDCQLTTVDEIATAVYQVLGEIQQESGFTD